MAIHVPIKNIISPQHLTAFVFADQNMQDKVKMEVYTGWLIVGHESTDPPIFRQDFVSFVPVDNLTVQPYQANDLLDVTVTAAPSSVSDADEANVAAVDVASVALEPQSFGVGPNVLVLRARVAGERSIVHTITYQVTVLTRISQDSGIEPIRLDRDETPRPN